MTKPPLPKPAMRMPFGVYEDNRATPLFTEDQLIAYRAEVIEMCANAIHEIPRNVAWVIKVEAIETLEKLKWET